MSIQEDIIFLLDKYSLVHYMIYRINAANLPARPIMKGQNVDLIQYTPESTQRMREFVALCVQTWNEGHEEQLDTTDIYELFSEMRQRDILDFQKRELVPT